MANHCYNVISFDGDQESINKFITAFEKAEEKVEDITFDQFCDLILGKTEEGTDYGTKWFDYSSEEEDERFTLRGDSAWGPPIGFVQEVCKVFGLEGVIGFEEPGDNFAGEYIFDTSGKVTQKDDFTYLDHVIEQGYLDDLFDYVSYETLEEFLEEVKDGTSRELSEKIIQDLTKVWEGYC